jgi:hypothetical protein
MQRIQPAAASQLDSLLIEMAELRPSCGAGTRQEADAALRELQDGRVPWPGLLGLSKRNTLTGPNTLQSFLFFTASKSLATVMVSDEKYDCCGRILIYVKVELRPRTSGRWLRELRAKTHPPAPTCADVHSATIPSYACRFDEPRPRTVCMQPLASENADLHMA